MSRTLLRRRIASLAMVGLLVLFSASQTLAEQPSAAVPTAASPPSADSIIERFVEALGGVDALKKHSSFSMRGDVELPLLNLKGQFSASFTAPDKFYSDYSVPGYNARIEGHDGSTGWRIEDGVYPRIVQGRELQDMLLMADFYAELNYRDNYEIRETLEKVTFADTECWKVQLVTDYREEFLQYFDTQTGLLLGRTSWVGSQEESFEVTEIFSDYRRIDGRLFPMVTRQQFTGIEQIITLTDVQFNQVEESVYELPEAVAKLLEASSDEDP